MDSDKALVIFQGKEIRRTWHNEQWYFSVVDVVEVLTDSLQPREYIKDMRRRDPELSKGWGQIATPILISILTNIFKSKIEIIFNKNFSNRIFLS